MLHYRAVSCCVGGSCVIEGYWAKIRNTFKGITQGGKASSWPIRLFLYSTFSKKLKELSDRNVSSPLTHDIKEWCQVQVPAQPPYHLIKRNATDRIDNKSKGERIGTCSTGFANRYCSVVLAFGSAICCLWCVVYSSQFGFGFGSGADLPVR